MQFNSSGVSCREQPDAHWAEEKLKATQYFKKGYFPPCFYLISLFCKLLVLGRVYIYLGYGALKDFGTLHFGAMDYHFRVSRVTKR